MFLFVIALDFGRVFFYSQVITACARNGALYACDANTQAKSPYASVEDAALASAAGLTPAPTVSSSTTTDASGNACVQVTVAWQFQTITSYPGIPTTVDLVRTVQMRVAPK
jgi:hypothetical protein